MMKKQIGLLLLLVLFGMNGNFVFGRGGTTPTVTVVPTITHGTCFNTTGTIEFEIVVTSEWENKAKMNAWRLEDDVPTLIEASYDPNLIGVVTGLSVGVYTLSGSISALNSDGMWVGIPFSATFWVGIQAVWTEKIDMISSPNSYSAIQNAVTNNLGGVRSSNEIDSGVDGWIEMKAQYGTTTNSHVYWIMGETNPLGTFTVNFPNQFVEFYKTSAGNGIRVKHEDFGGNFVYDTISTNPIDKVRLVRTGTNLKLYLNNSTSSVFTFQAPPSGPMNIAVRTQQVGDGCLDVVSSFECKPIESDLYGHLKYKLDGFYHIMKNGHIKFVFDQEYDADDLVFNIYNQSDLLVATDSDFAALSTTYGDNYLLIDVSDAIHCIGKGFFYLEVTNSKKEKSYLRFFNDFVNPACLDYIDVDESND